MSNPLVSVIIPAYNAGPFIVETLSSVLAQTYRPMEILVIDDGSQDDTVLKIKTFTDEVEVFSQNNCGPAAARNHGLKKAHGEFIAFLDADDLWTPDKISRQIRAFEKYPSIGMLCADMVDFGDEVHVSESHFQKRGLNCSYFGDAVFVKNAFYKIFTQNFISTPSVLIRREIIDKIGLFPEAFRYGEDYIFWLRAACVTEIGYQSTVFVLRRLHKGNLTNDLGNHVVNRIKILDAIAAEHADHFSSLGLSSLLRNRYSSAWFQLAYYRLFQESQTDVTGAFWKSFCYRPQWRSAAYCLATGLGLGRLGIYLKSHLRGQL